MKVVEDADPTMHCGPESSIDSYALMRRADVVFTYGSTSGVEAAFQGRPVVVMGPSAYDALGCALRITTEEEIAHSIDRPPAPAPERAIPYGLMMQRRGFVYRFGHRDSDGTPTFGGKRLDEARELIRKISARLRSGKIQRLLG